MATAPDIGAQIRARVQSQLAASAAQRAARRAAFAERMHHTVQHTESALGALGSEVLHDFEAGNYQAGADAIRRSVESSINQARANGVKVSVQNTGGQKKYGTA